MAYYTENLAQIQSVLNDLQERTDTQDIQVVLGGGRIEVEQLKALIDHGVEIVSYKPYTVIGDYYASDHQLQEDLKYIFSNIKGQFSGGFGSKSYISMDIVIESLQSLKDNTQLTEFNIMLPYNTTRTTKFLTALCENIPKNIPINLGRCNNIGNQNRQENPEDILYKLIELKLKLTNDISIDNSLFYNSQGGNDLITDAVQRIKELKENIYHEQYAKQPEDFDTKADYNDFAAQRANEQNNLLRNFFNDVTDNNLIDIARSNIPIMQLFITDKLLTNDILEKMNLNIVNPKAYLKAHQLYEIAKFIDTDTITNNWGINLLQDNNEEADNIDHEHVNSVIGDNT